MPATTAPIARALSIPIALLMAVASAAGLFVPGLYRDNAWVVPQLRGNDVVTLFVAVPLLVGALPLARRGSLRGELVWLAMLGYALYNYAFYLFGTAFNPLFLVYAATFALAVFALILGLSAVDAAAVARRFSPRTPVRFAGGWFVLVAATLGLLWTGATLAATFAGTVPQVVADSGHPTAIVFAIDLTLLVPAMALAGVWLWRRRPWGYVLGAVVGVKGATYGLALVGMSVFALRAGIPDALALLGVWSAIAGVSAVAVAVLLAGIRPSGEASSAP